MERSNASMKKNPDGLPVARAYRPPPGGVCICFKGTRGIFSFKSSLNHIPCISADLLSVSFTSQPTPPLATDLRVTSHTIDRHVTHVGVQVV